MSDIYNAAYDAIRLEISNLANQINIVAQDFSLAAYEHKRPSVLYKPSIYIDGDLWCALYGENLQDGVAGFGETPEKAMIDFDINWLNRKPRLNHDH